MCWASRGSREYAPTTVDLDNEDGAEWGNTKKLFTGRVSKAKLVAAAPEIAKWLGVAVADLPPIDRRKTFVWQGQEVQYEDTR
jgi:hypothetical protein